MVCPYVLAHLIFKYKRHHYMCSYSFVIEIVFFLGGGSSSTFSNQYKSEVTYAH